MLRRIRHTRQDRFLFTLIMSISVLLLAGSLLFYFLERKCSFLDSVWWTIVSVTTVGYGDIVPSTPPGKVLGIFIIISGFIILSVTTALVSSMLISRKLKQERGLSNILCKDHLVICGWNRTTDQLIKELLADSRTMEIVLVNSLPEEQISEVLYNHRKSGVQFVRGDFSSELVLDRAAAGKAAVVIITPDTSDENKRPSDEKTVLAAYTIRAINPKCRIFAHILSSESIQHLKKAQVDDYVISDFNVGYMLGKMVTEPGVPQSVKELLGSFEGHSLKRIETPKELIGATFKDAAEHCRKKGMIALGLMREQEVFSLKKMLSDDESYLDEFIAMKFRNAGRTFRETSRTDIRLNPPDDEKIEESMYILVMI